MMARLGLKKIQEHLSAVLKHWVFLMSGTASVAIAIYEQFRRAAAVPGWFFLIISAICFFVAFHQAWFDKDTQLLEKERELLRSLGDAPEVVIEWQCAKRNPLVLRNLRGSTAYHIKIRDVVIKDRLTAIFDEVSHIEEGRGVNVLPSVSDKCVNQRSDEWKDIKDNFMHVMEAVYQAHGHDFAPVQLALLMEYEDKNERRYTVFCNIEFDGFRNKAIVICEPPKTGIEPIEL
jgi:hypothetical protein